MNTPIDDTTGFTSPTEIHQAFIKLKYISGLPPGSKYNISTYSYSAWGPFQWFFRGIIHGENKEHTIEWITTVITQSIELVKEHPQYAARIIKAIRETTSALNYLKVTYHAYPLITSKIQTLIENIAYPRLENELKISSSPINIVQRRESSEDQAQTYDESM